MRSITLVLSLFAALVTASPARADAVVASESGISFAHYAAPFPNRAGESSIGVNPHTNNAFVQFMLKTARISWDDAPFPAATWTLLDPPINNTNDPILWTDPATGRTFVVHLQANQLSSYVAYTDDEGATWTFTVPPLSHPSWDHETIGGGRYGVLPQGLNPVYPNVLYFCAQFVIAECSRSDTGGLTWNPPTVLAAGLCGGSHGHVEVDSVGRAYVPNKSCYGAGEDGVRFRQGVIVSDTEGLTWVPSAVPGTRPSLSDPDIAFDRADKMYFAASSEGRPLVATSADAGATWSTPVDVGAPFGIRNTEQPLVIGGDAGRAAVAFYGTTTEGNDQAESFPGVWHLYASFTYDGGGSWETIDLTPDNPVQRGCIWLQGGSNPCRNLLEFQGIAMDAQGRVLISYGDGCTERANCDGLGTGEWDGKTRDSRGKVARQTTGKSLLAAFDPPSAPPVAASAGGPYRTAAAQCLEPKNPGPPPGTGQALERVMEGQEADVILTSLLQSAPHSGVSCSDVSHLLEAQAVGGRAPYTFAWDLDADGVFDDAAGRHAFFPPSPAGVHPLAVRVTDASGAVSTAPSSVIVADPTSQAQVQGWTFAAGDGSCVDDGWTATSTPPSPAAWHLVGPPCAWYHGIDELGSYTWTQGIDLTSPCITLAPDAASASLRMHLEGRTVDSNFLTVQTLACDGGLPTKAASFSGAQSGQVTADLASALGQGPFRVRLHFQGGDLTIGVPPWPEGYRVSDIQLWAQ